MSETAIQKLSQFSQPQLQYMQARLSTTTDKEAALAVGIAPTTVYSWPEKQLIDNVLAEMQRDVVQKAAIKLTNAVDRAVDVLLDEMENHKGKGNRFNAALEVLNRVLGKAPASLTVRQEGAPDTQVIIVREHIERERTTERIIEKSG